MSCPGAGARSYATHSRDSLAVASAAPTRAPTAKVSSVIANAVLAWGA